MTDRWLYQIRGEPVLPEALRPEVTSLDRWYRPLSEPTPGDELLATTAHAAFAIDAQWTFAAPAEEFTLDKWYRPLSAPLFDVDPLPTGAKPFFTIDTELLLQPEATSVDKWFKPLNEPSFERFAVLRNPAALGDMGAAQETLVFGANSWDNNAQAWDDSTRDWDDNEILDAAELAWYKPLPEPLYDVEGLTTAAHLAFAIDASQLTLSEDIQLDKWWAPFATIVRFPPALESSLQQSFTIDAASLLVPGLEITPDSWHRPLSEPVMVQPPLPTGAQQALTIDAAALTQPEATSLDRWYQALSEPVRPPFDVNRLGVNHLFYVAEPILPLSPPMDSWYRRLVGPPAHTEVEGLPTGLQTAFAADLELFKVPWVPETALTGTWVAEGMATGAWTPEGTASGSWTEEEPEC